MSTATNYIGNAVSRVDGPAKVTGGAQYAADFKAPNLAHGFAVSSPIPKGRIRRIDAREALAVPGVIAVLTHENRPRMARDDEKYQDEVAPGGSPFRPLGDDVVRFCGQPVALVVAEDLETARYAASLLHIDYRSEPCVTDLERKRGEAYKLKPTAKPRGDAEKAFAQAAVQVDAEYRSPIEHHNPIETHAALALWDDSGNLTAYDKTQGVKNSQNYLAGALCLAPGRVRVLSPFVGGAFGSGLRPQYQLMLAAMAARMLKRSVRVVMTRQQMYTHGYRPETIQRVALGADKNGKLTAVMHDALAITSQYEEFKEHVTNWSGVLYTCENTKFSHKLARVDRPTPADMRAPGGSLGVYALECAMDELAVTLGMDPIELRMMNFSDRDQNAGKPLSSNEVRACYRQGAEAFGWSKRKPEPRSMRQGRELVGYGVATGIWKTMQEKTSVRLALAANGALEVSSATADIGTGTYTIMAQIAAEMLGHPIGDVIVKLGDSSLPEAPVEGGSYMAASIGAAIHKACCGLRGKILRLAQKVPGSALKGVKIDAVDFVDGAVRHKSDPARAVSILEAMRHANADRLEQDATAEEGGDKSYARYAHTAVFAEVRVDEDLGVVRVPRIVNAVAAGRILNPKTARSQIMGGVVWGIGMALHEETLTDHALGRYVNNNLAEYHVPVNADIHDIDVIFVDEHDTIVNPLGIKGIGEIGVVGTAAAIANAVYHATGTRIRNLPITLDKVLRPST